MHNNEILNGAFDVPGGALKVQDSETALIHSGDSYDVSSVDNVVADTATLVFTGETGALPVHFHDLAVSSTGGPVLIELIEDPTITVAGSAVTPYNRNRISANTALLTVKGGATITGGTTLSQRAIAASGVGANDVGGAQGFSGEWVLAPNTTYAVRITNQSGAAATIGADFYFYELALS